MMETGEIIYEEVYESPRPPPKISFKDNWMKELGSEVAGGTGDSQQIQPKSKTQISIKERLVSEQPPGLLTKEIETDVLFGCESTNSRTERPVKSCVPVSVECGDEDKDADENVDADQTRTGRPVSGQPTGLFTQLEEIDIDFRVSGLPHAVVKQAENFRVRELVKKIESHPHRQALQADFQHVDVQRLVDQKKMKKNACQMPISFLCMQKDLEKDNGHLLVLVLRKSGTLSVKIVHKESGTIWRKECWNLQKADVQFSVLQVHCPEVDSEAKVVENCRYTIQPIWKRLRLFFA